MHTKSNNITNDAEYIRHTTYIICEVDVKKIIGKFNITYNFKS